MRRGAADHRRGAAHHPTAARDAIFGWTEVVVDPACSVEVTTDPGRLAIDLPWQPCAAQAVGCRELSLRGADRGSWIDLTGTHHRGEVFVAVSTSSGDRLRHAVGPRDAPPRVGIEGPRTEACSIAGIALGGDAAVVEVAFDIVDGSASRAFLQGTIGPDSAWTRPPAILRRQDHPEAIAESFATAGGRVYALDNGGPLRWFDRALGAWVEVDRRGGTSWVQGGVDMATYGDERPWILRDGQGRPLLDRSVDAIGIPAIDGDRVVWVEGRSADPAGGFGAVSLWTGSLGETGVLGAAELGPLRTRRLPAPRLGGGVVAVLDDDDRRTLAILRLGSGERRVFTTRGKEVIEQIVWVGSDEVAVQVGLAERSTTPSRVLRLAVESIPRDAR